MGSWMYLHRDVYQEALLHGQWLLDRTNLPDILSAGHSFHQAVARNRQAPRRKGLLPEMEEAIVKVDSAADFIRGDINNRADAGAESLEEDKRAGSIEPLILPICRNMTNCSFYSYISMHITSKA